MRPLSTICSAILLVQISAFGAKRPVRVRVAADIVEPVSPGNVPLEKYMQLPATQYTCVPMPLNSSLSRIHGSVNEFRLCVPQMNFNLPGIVIEVLPEVMAQVQVEPDKVVIFSDTCTIRGSPIIDQLKLNDRFEFCIHAYLTWEQEQNKGKVIKSKAEIKVDLFPPGQLSLIPRQIIEPVGNMAMSLVLTNLLGAFMVSLRKDYERWSSDGAYRIERQKLEDELGAKLEKEAMAA